MPPEVVAEAGFSVQGLVFDRMKTTSPLLRKWMGGGGSVEPFAEQVPQRLVAALLGEFGGQVVLGD